MSTFLRPVFGIVWHGVKAPAQRAVFKVIGTDVAAAAGEVGAAAADDNYSASNDRSASDCVRRFRPPRRQRIDLPQAMAGCRIERVQIPVKCAHVDAPLPDCEPAVDGVAACVAPPLTIDSGIVGPQLTTGGRIDRVHMAEIANRV